MKQLRMDDSSAVALDSDWHDGGILFWAPRSQGSASVRPSFIHSFWMHSQPNEDDTNVHNSRKWTLEWMNDCPTACPLTWWMDRQLCEGFKRVSVLLIAPASGWMDVSDWRIEADWNGKDENDSEVEQSLLLMIDSYLFLSSDPLLVLLGERRFIINHSRNWQLTVRTSATVAWMAPAIITSLEWSGVAASALALESECGKQSIFYDFCIDALSCLVYDDELPAPSIWCWYFAVSWNWSHVYPVAAAVDVERGSEKGDEEGKSKKPTCELSVKIEKWKVTGN